MIKHISLEACLVSLWNIVLVVLCGLFVFIDNKAFLIVMYLMCHMLCLCKCSLSHMYFLLF